MDTLVSSYNSFYPEQDTSTCVYTNLDQYQADIANENTHFYDFYPVTSSIIPTYTTDHFYARDSSWDSIPHSEEMDKSLEDVSKLPTDGWRHKYVQTWTSLDIMNWIIYEIKRQGENYENVAMKAYVMTGEILCSMNRFEFENNDPKFGGMLYDALQILKNSQLPYTSISNSCLPSFTNFKQADDSFGGESVLTCLHPKKQYPICSDAESECSLGGINVKQKRSDRPGRPTTAKRTRKQEKKTGRLWEFIRDLLKNREYCPSLICWENYDEGVFRFVRSDKVAELWGTIKENPRMTYEKLSRAMRNYYASGILEPVPKTGQYPKRLVYKFGQAAIWKTPSECQDGSERILLQEQSPPASSGKAAGVQIWSFSNRLAHPQPKF